MYGLPQGDPNNNGRRWNVVSGKKMFLASGQFVVPEGVFTVWLTGTGAGGGATNSATSTATGGGGQGGRAVAMGFPVTPGQTYAVTVGAGGTSGVSGSTSFGSLLVLTGGTSSVNTLVGGAGGGGGNIPGAQGGDAPNLSTQGMGGGGVGGGSTTPGTLAPANSGFGTSGTDNITLAGADGHLLVEW